MIAQLYLQTEEYKKTLESFLKGLKISYEISLDINQFKVSSLKRRPLVFFIQADRGSSLEIKSLVGDIREIFGSLVTIIIFGNSMSRKKLVSFIAEGADQFFSFPFDEALIEDFLHKRTGSDYFNGFKYRNTPTRSSHMNLLFEQELVELNAKGLILKGKSLIKNGTSFSVMIGPLNPNFPSEIMVRVIRVEMVDNDNFLTYCLFDDLNEDQRSTIINELR